MFSESWKYFWPQLYIKQIFPYVVSTLLHTSQETFSTVYFTQYKYHSSLWWHDLHGVFKVHLGVKYALWSEVPDFGSCWKHWVDDVGFILMMSEKKNTHNYKHIHYYRTSLNYMAGICMCFVSIAKWNSFTWYFNCTHYVNFVQVVDGEINTHWTKNMVK